MHWVRLRGLTGGLPGPFRQLAYTVLPPSSFDPLFPRSGILTIVFWSYFSLVL